MVATVGKTILGGKNGEKSVDWSKEEISDSVVLCSLFVIQILENDTSTGSTPDRQLLIHTFSVIVLATEENTVTQQLIQTPIPGGFDGTSIVGLYL